MNYKIILLSLIWGVTVSYAAIPSIDDTPLADTNKTKHKYPNLVSDLEQLKWKNKVLAAQLELKKLKYKNQHYEEEIIYKKRLERLKNDATLAEVKAKKISDEMEIKKSEWELKSEQLEAELDIFKMQYERKRFTDKEPIYLPNPLVDDNQTLIISDRRIALDGVITSRMSERISRKINYFNNKDNSKPIFLVITSSPGGSVMAGYQILKAIESSKSPVYVVLKSFSASMASIIVTFSERSYAYSHATMLHHQPSSYLHGSSNLTEQKEDYRNLEKWWKYLGTPVAKKMGITIDEFQKEMYKHSSHGDWVEFASDAQKLKWVGHVVEHIEDTSVLVDNVDFKFYHKDKKRKKSSIELEEERDNKGKIVVRLPHLMPTDVYFLYSPDGYYQAW